MKTRADFRNMFEPADAGFEDAVQRALWGIRGRERNAVRRKLSVELVFAVLLSLLLAAALAAAFRWGVLDFATGRGGGTKVLPEATKLVRNAQSIPQTGGHLPDADFSVRQAVYDGEQVYLVVSVKPKTGDVLLVDDWTIPTDSVAALGPEYRGREGSVADYAKTNGKAHILSVQIFENTLDDWSPTSQQCATEEDGTLAIMLSGAYEGGSPELRLSLPCSLKPFVQDGSGEWTLDEEAQEVSTIDLALAKVDGSAADKHSAESVDFPEAGVRVDAVMLTGTPMAVYYQIEYEVTDAEKYVATGGVAFAFLDGKGDTLPFGAAESGGFEPIEGMDYEEGGSGPAEGKRLVQRGSLNAMEVLPESMTLAAYDALGKGAYYGAREIPMK